MPIILFSIPAVRVANHAFTFRLSGLPIMLFYIQAVWVANHAFLHSGRLGCQSCSFIFRLSGLPIMLFYIQAVRVANHAFLHSGCLGCQSFSFIFRLSGLPINSARGDNRRSEEVVPASQILRTPEQTAPLVADPPPPAYNEIFPEDYVFDKEPTHSSSAV